jgi:heme/copper-type cytochrome/quinol oxidase subunit 3
VYLTLPAVALVLAGVLLLAVLSSLVLEFAGLRRRDATVVFWHLLLGIWLGALFVVALLRSQGL